MVAQPKKSGASLGEESAAEIRVLLRVALYANFSVLVALILFLVSFSVSPFEPIVALQIFGLGALFAGLVANVIIISRRHPEWIMPRFDKFWRKG